MVTSEVYGYLTHIDGIPFIVLTVDGEAPCCAAVGCETVSMAHSPVTFDVNNNSLVNRGDS